MCRIQFIYRQFKLQGRACGTCDRCVKRPIEIARRQAQAAETAKVPILHQAIAVITAMKEKCLICKKHDCAGLTKYSCYKQRKCINCNASDHTVSACKFQVGTVTARRACYKCWMYKNVAGATYHEPDACPVKYRLRRMVFITAERQNISVKECLTKIYASEESYLTWVASHK